MKFRPETTDESLPAVEFGAGITTNCGAGRAQRRGIKDPSDSYGQEKPKRDREIAEREGQ